MTCHICGRLFNIGHTNNNKVLTLFCSNYDLICKDLLLLISLVLVGLDMFGQYVMEVMNPIPADDSAEAR